MELEPIVVPDLWLESLRHSVLPMLEDWSARFAATPWIGLAVGAALLLFGRRLFWLLVTAVGFLAGFALSQRILSPAEPWVVLLVGVAAGLVGILLMVFVQKLAVAVAAFLVGGYAALWLATHTDLVVGSPLSASDAATPWIVFLVGGAVAALLGQFFFRVALIVASSLAGAFLIVQALLATSGMESRWSLPAVAVLFLLGVLVQSRGRKRR
jgi:hypothetical protein